MAQLGHFQMMTSQQHQQQGQGPSSAGNGHGQDEGAAAGGDGHDGIVESLCICNRKSNGVACLCGYCKNAVGLHVSRICPVHPRIVFAMDIKKCPRCGSSENLMEY